LLHVKGQHATKEKSETVETEAPGQPATDGKPEERIFHIRERLETSFERRFTLPVEADLETARASLGDGLLEIHIRKTRRPKPRTVTIGE
jgi:HSP20 family molecular chaperone IbpA